MLIAQKTIEISIHAPRMGSDHPDVDYLIVANQFQSTLPGWGATAPFRRPAGRDPLFQSTLPGWGATAETFDRDTVFEFQSTLPGWGATVIHRVLIQRAHISIHAPRMGSDRENGHLRPRYGQNHPFSTLIVSQIVVDVLGTVRKSQKHQRTSHYEVIKQPERRK